MKSLIERQEVGRCLFVLSKLRGFFVLRFDKHVEQSVIKKDQVDHLAATKLKTQQLAKCRRSHKEIVFSENAKKKNFRNSESEIMILLVDIFPFHLFIH